MRVPWTARSSNLSILKDINPEYSSEELKMKLKLQHFCHLMWKCQLTGKILMMIKTEDKRRGLQRMSWLGSISVSMDMNLSKLQEILEDRGALHCIVQRVIKSQTLLSD